MSLKITNIQKNGPQSDEYILLEAQADVNLRAYAITDVTYDKHGNLSNLHKHYFRFPKFDLKKGQFVALYTKKGTDQNGTTNSGKFCRYVFWGFDKPILNDNEIESIEVLNVVTRDIKKIS